MDQPTRLKQDSVKFLAAYYPKSELKSNFKYRQTSDIWRTKYQNINVSRFVLQFFLPNPLKPGVKLKM